jgi:hypothetical protein
MKIHLFKENSKVETAVLKRMASYIGRILEIDYHIEDSPIGEINSLEDLQRIADLYLLEKKKPLIGMVYTMNNIDQKSSALGIASCRVALIRYDSKDFKKLVLTTLHELGHLCDADHCKSNYCLMYPVYQPLPVDKTVFRELLCNRCFAIISRSWVYRLLKRKE